MESSERKRELALMRLLRTPSAGNAGARDCARELREERTWEPGPCTRACTRHARPRGHLARAQRPAAPHRPGPGPARATRGPTARRAAATRPAALAPSRLCMRDPTASNLNLLVLPRLCSARCCTAPPPSAAPPIDQLATCQLEGVACRRRGLHLSKTMAQII